MTQAARTLSAGPSENPVPAVFPLHLALSGRLVVVIGGGPVGARKVNACLDAGAIVRLVSPWACPDLREHAEIGHIGWTARSYRHGDLTGAWLAFAATSDPSVNDLVAAEAEHRRLFCVRTDEAALGSARSPAVLSREGVVVGVSSVGPAADPARIRELRTLLAGALDVGLRTVPAQRARD